MGQAHSGAPKMFFCISLLLAALIPSVLRSSPSLAHHFWAEPSATRVSKIHAAVHSRMTRTLKVTYLSPLVGNILPNSQQVQLFASGGSLGDASLPPDTTSRGSSWPILSVLALPMTALFALFRRSKNVSATPASMWTPLADGLEASVHVLGVTGGNEASSNPGLPPPGASADPFFEQLCADSGTVSQVHLSPLATPSQRGLCATQAVAEGGVLLDIPLSICLIEPRDLPEDVAAELPPSFTWDVRLAVKLLEAIEGRWSDFWTNYATLFPAPTTMALPLLLPPQLLQELHHPEAAAAAMAQQERLRELFPEMMPTVDAPPAAYPSPLMWAWALVRSRAFTCGANHFAFVPFLDMANHADIPNANFECEPAVDRRYRLRALRNIRAGEEVTISYGERMDNQHRFAQYGFVEPGGNPNDHLPSMDPSLTISWPRICATLKSRGVDATDLDGLQPAVAATLNSLQLVQGAEMVPVEEEIRHVEALQGALRQTVATQFVTSFGDDITAVKQMMSSRQPLDHRRLAVLMYRVERKMLCASALAILEDHRQALTEASTAAEK